MYDHYEYGSQHTVAGLSSQPNPFSYSSQPNVGGSSFQPNVGGSSSLKPNRRHQTAPKKKPQNEKGKDQRCYPWTPEEKTALCKGWVRTSEDSVVVNARKERGYWVEILKYMKETCPITKRRTYDMVNGKWKIMLLKVAGFYGVYANTILTYISGAGDANYLQMALTDYHVEYKVLEEKKNKRYKFRGGSRIVSQHEVSGEGSINLNTTIGDEEDEVEKVRRPRLMGRDQAKKKAKVRSAAGSANAFDVESLANMMANEYVMTSNPYNVQKSQVMSELLRIKNKELELKAAELEI
ncbi:hypothetical protein Tco_0461191 [Tanacetum coccineum]